MIQRNKANNEKIVTVQGDDYTSRCVLDCCYFKENYKLITTDLMNQQAIDVDSTEMQQFTFMEIYINQEIQQNFPLLKKQKKKENLLNFSQGTIRLL